ncbi:MAG: S-layer homology domain-containing protein [Clostridia bacterium]|nr:S-layer homology domain-containing protein [Clostridia bacterium]
MKKIISMLLGMVLLASCLVVSAAEYTDVPSTSKFYKAVAYLSEQEIINGYENGTYQPYDKITRAEVAAIVTRVLDLPIDFRSAGIFSDVTLDAWFAGFVNAAAKAGILNGMGDGTFQPNQPVTYHQMVKICVYILNLHSEAEQNGGWPYGNAYVAHKNKIVSDRMYERLLHSDYGNQEAIRGDVAMMMYAVVNPGDDVWNVSEEAEVTDLANRFVNDMENYNFAGAAALTDDPDGFIQSLNGVRSKEELVDAVAGSYRDDETVLAYAKTYVDIMQHYTKYELQKVTKTGEQYEIVCQMEELRSTDAVAQQVAAYFTEEALLSLLEELYYWGIVNNSMTEDQIMETLLSEAQRECRQDMFSAELPTEKTTLTDVVVLTEQGWLITLEN